MMGAVEGDDPADPAFYRRIAQLYELYDEWVGSSPFDGGEDDDDDDEMLPPTVKTERLSMVAGPEGRAPRARQVRRGAEAVIDPVDAVQTLILFVARLSVDLGIERENFEGAVRDVFDEMEDESQQAGDRLRLVVLVGQGGSAGDDRGEPS